MTRHADTFLFLGVMMLVALVGGVAGGTETPGFEPAPVPEAASFAATVSGAQPSAPPSPLPPAPVRPTAFHRVGNEADPALAATAAIVADLETGESYFELEADKRWPMASITKLVTALVADERINGRSPITLGTRDFTAIGGDRSTNLRPGETYLLSDLIGAMLTFSSNEAAEAIANTYGREEFLLAMNLFATKWGLTTTYFSDPTGLSAANQSTARELTVLGRRIYEDAPALVLRTRAAGLTLRELSAPREFFMSNINLFAGKPGFLGGKTGYTDEAKSNLLSFFRVGGRPVVIVVLGAEDRFAETQKLLDWFGRNFQRTETL